MDRLRADGRWTAFQTQRDELRSQGMATDEAWAQLAPQYQPLAAPRPVPMPPEALEFMGDFNPATDTDVIRNVQWAYANFGTFVSPPPSPGAVELLNWARSNRTAFFKDIVPKLRPTVPDEEQRLRDDGRKIFDIIQRFRHANKISVSQVDGKNDEVVPAPNSAEVFA